MTMVIRALLLILATAQFVACQNILLKDVYLPEATETLSDWEWQKLAAQNTPRADNPNAAPILQPEIAGKTSIYLEKQIVGGSLASLGQFPWQALIYIDNTYLCGGSLILANWVLTAAHCAGTNYKIYLGRISRVTLSPGTVLVLTSISYTHPLYNRTTLNNDIALINLGISVNFTTNISPVKLPSLADANTTFVGILATVSGFGKTGDNETTSNDLKFTQMTVIPNENCSSRYVAGLVVDSTICTVQANTSTCSGDSGGPLVYKDANNTWVQIGVVSFGASTGCLVAPSGRGNKPRWHYCKMTVTMRTLLLILLTTQCALLIAGATISSSLKFQSKTFPNSDPKLSDAEWKKLVDQNKPKIDDKDAKSIPQPKEAGQKKTPDKFIVGGSLATLGQFPWQAFLSIDNAWLCGGSLILADWVLTAAHCSGTTYEVNLGTIGLNTLSAGAVTITTSVSYPHELYNENNLNNDVCLVKLGSPVTFTANILPVKLASLSDATNTFEGTLATVSGFGKTADDQGVSSGLKFTQVTVRSYKDCASYYGTSVVIDSTICTRQQNTSTCQGDSGGPLVYKNADNVWVQIGVVSFGSSDGCLEGYSGFARVTSFLGWMSGKIGQDLSGNVTTTTGPNSETTTTDGTTTTGQDTVTNTTDEVTTTMTTAKPTTTKTVKTTTTKTPKTTTTKTPKTTTTKTPKTTTTKTPKTTTTKTPKTTTTKTPKTTTTKTPKTTTTKTPKTTTTKTPKTTKAKRKI
ncbi:Hypothetical predicted protein [Cloeon dipterum]|uniref:Peptidase S1 domain-containing protein n=1 Tax=Cloeon dipterum TaxID=197152 RepID=A0A8S1DNC4_9INSE|nr:Hypothetical predicted protein [Cloeon dipterum]